MLTMVIGTFDKAVDVYNNIGLVLIVLICMQLMLWNFCCLL